jgi:hypothetical protein
MNRWAIFSQSASRTIGRTRLVTDGVHNLYDSLAAMPAKVRALVEGLSPEENRWKPSPDDFAAVEQVSHLRDIEVDGYAVRIGRILSEENPFLPDLDGAAMAVDRCYMDDDIEAALKAFVAARESNILLIRSLTEEQLAREGNLEHTGTVSIAKLVRMMAEHDGVHLGELGELRGKLMSDKL